MPRAPVERPGAGSPALPESVSNHLTLSGHPTDAGEPAGMPDAGIQKHLLLRNILQSSR